MTEEARFVRLASLIGVVPDQLARHTIRPLPQPADSTLGPWVVPPACQEVFAITDGFSLFGTEDYNGFRLWGTKDYFLCFESGGGICEQAVHDGLFPIYGLVPHLTSVSVSDGFVVATDWECFGDVKSGWRRVIAPDLFDYLRALIAVREAYGNEEGYPSDWWGPYASHGTRYDLE
jgi:hypothetical protein